MPKVSELTNATTPLDGTETVYVVQGGNSRKTTVSQIVAINGDVTPQLFGAVADYDPETGIGTDNVAAVQSYIEYCEATGRRAYFPAGRYYFSSGLTIQREAVPDEGFFYEKYTPTICGDGVRATQLFFGPGDFACVDIEGAFDTSNNPSWQLVEDLAINKTGARAGSALRLRGHFHAHVKDVRVMGANIGIECIDVHETLFTNVVSLFNNGGMMFQKGVFTQPNIIVLNNCTAGLNANYGIDLINPATFTMTGGSIEGNGIDSVEPVRWGVRAIYDDVFVEGSVGLNLIGVYLEANSVDADVWFVNADAAHMVHNIIGCSFQKTLASAFAVNCIRYDWSGTSYENVLNMTGNGFRSFNDYVPDAGRPYVNITGSGNNFEFNQIGNFFEDAVEAPNNSVSWLGFAKGVKTNSFGGVTDVGTVEFGRNFASVTKTGTGTYEVVFTRPLDALHYHISFTTVGGAPAIYAIIAKTINGFTVESRNPSTNALVDSRFSFGLVGGLND